MGLTEFVKDLGKKIFGQEDEASAKIKDYMEAQNPGIKDLGVNFQDGVVTLSGAAESVEAMQKAVLMAGNIQGVSGVKIDNVTTPAGAERDDRPILALSSTGELVKQVQAKVGAGADGIFGPKTEAAVRAFQSAHGLDPDGIVGPKTWRALDSVP
jgi:peptidoglycan hydrolase-like protein with peptidoglycan-binding domain